MISRELAMKQQDETVLRRRDLLRAAVAGVAAVTVAAAVTGAPAAEAPKGTDKRRARYQANSAEVQNFYRVNRYPVR
jgi:hypothetical protein